MAHIGQSGPESGPGFQVREWLMGDLARARRFYDEVLSHRMYLLISFRKSTPPQNRQLIVCYY